MKNKQETIGFMVNKNDFFKKFTKGRIGKRFNDFMNSEEIRAYLEKNVVEWATPFVDEIINFKLRDAFRNMINFENIYYSMASMIFAKSLEEWMKTGGNLDSIILSNVTIEELQDNVKTFKTAFKKLILKMAKEQPDPAEIFEEKDSIYMMPSARTSKWIN